LNKKNDRASTYRECQKILSKHNIKTESKRVVVAFVDIIGFGPWIKRAHALSDFHFLITQLYRKLVHFHNDLGYHVKFLGDGAMIVKEMNPGHNCGMAIKFLRDMDCLAGFMTEVIKKTAWPRPEGFRVRLAAGHVSKLSINVCERECALQKDYIGYPVNLAARMLDVLKDTTPLLCHESVKDIVGPKKSKVVNLVFTKQLKPHKFFDGVDVEDLDHLWEFKFNGKP